MVGRAFAAAVPTSIVIAAVAIGFTNFFVVLPIEGNEVVEGKAIVASNEVGTLHRFAFPLTINGWTAEQAVGLASY